MTNSDSWCSPPEIGDPLFELFQGPVDVDPCSNGRSIIRARRSLTAGGLILPWCIPNKPGARSVYQNDPYSQAGTWTDKMLEELDSGNVQELVRLSMMATSTRWWAKMCREPVRNPRILALCRLKFLDPFAAIAGQKRMVCRFEPALTYIGKDHRRFDREFAHLTRWSTWGR